MAYGRTIWVHPHILPFALCVWLSPSLLALLRKTIEARQSGPHDSIIQYWPFRRPFHYSRLQSVPEKCDPITQTHLVQVTFTFINQPGGRNRRHYDFIVDSSLEQMKASFSFVSLGNTSLIPSSAPTVSDWKTLVNFPRLTHTTVSVSAFQLLSLQCFPIRPWILLTYLWDGQLVSSLSQCNSILLIVKLDVSNENKCYIKYELFRYGHFCHPSLRKQSNLSNYSSVTECPFLQNINHQLYHSVQSINGSIDVSSIVLEWQDCKFLFQYCNNK